jgi:hypothetical protein
MDNKVNDPQQFMTWRHENLAKFAQEALEEIKALREERNTYRDAWRQLLNELGDLRAKTIR